MHKQQAAIEIFFDKTKASFLYSINAHHACCNHLRAEQAAGR